MYSITFIRGNKLFAIASPNQSTAFRTYMSLVNAGFICRIWNSAGKNSSGGG